MSETFVEEYSSHPRYCWLHSISLYSSFLEHFTYKMSMAHLLASIESLQKNLQEAQAKEASALKKLQAATAEGTKKDEQLRLIQEGLLKERAEVAKSKAMQSRVEKENEDLRAALARKDFEVSYCNAYGNASVASCYAEQIMTYLQISNLNGEMRRAKDAVVAERFVSGNAEEP